MDKLNFSGLPPRVIKQLSGEAPVARKARKEVVNRFKDFILGYEGVLREAEGVARSSNTHLARDKKVLDDFIEVLKTLNSIKLDRHISLEQSRKLVDTVTGKNNLLKDVYNLPRKGGMPPVLTPDQGKVDSAASDYAALAGWAMEDLAAAFVQEREQEAGFLNKAFHAIKVKDTKWAKPFNTFTKRIKDTLKRGEKSSQAESQEIEAGHTWYRRFNMKELKNKVKTSRRILSMERKTMQGMRFLAKGLRGAAAGARSFFAGVWKIGGRLIGGLFGVFRTLATTVIAAMPALIPWLLAGLGVTALTAAAYKFIFSDNNGDPNAPIDKVALAKSFGVGSVAYAAIRHPIKFVRAGFRGATRVISGLTKALSASRGMASRLASGAATLARNPVVRIGGKLLGPVLGLWGMYDGTKTLWNSKQGQGFFEGGMDSRAMGYFSSITGGASVGAAVGSVVPVVGTVLGAVVGGAVGGISALIADNKDNIASFLGLNKNIEQKAGTEMQQSPLGRRVRKLTVSMEETAKAAENSSKIAKNQQQGVTSGSSYAPSTPNIGNSNLPPARKALTNEQKSSISRVASNIGANPNDLAAVISFETGGTFSPGARNPKSSGTGLIQFMAGSGGTAGRYYGMTREQFAALSFDEQMKYVERYFTERGFKAGGNHNIADLYTAVTGYGYRRGSAAYNLNKVWDSNNDGYIAKGEMVQNAAFKAHQRDFFGNAPRTAVLQEASFQPRKTTAPVPNARTQQAVLRRRPVIDTTLKTTLRTTPFLPNDPALLGSSIVGL